MTWKQFVGNIFKRARAHLLAYGYVVSCIAIQPE